MAVINRVARGILSLLDAKTGGQLPDSIDRNVSGGLDFTPFLLADVGIVGAQEVQAATSANIGGVRAVVEVPTGEVWAIVAVSVTCVAPIAGGNFKIAPAIRAAGSATGYVNLADHNNSYAMTVGESTISAVAFSTPLILTSGGSLACRIVNSFGAQANVFTDVAFYRLGA